MFHLFREWNRRNGWNRVGSVGRNGDVVLFCLFEAAKDGGTRHIEGGGYLADGFAVALELEDFDDLVVVVGCAVATSEVVGFVGIALNLEAEAAVGLGNVEDDNVVGVVPVFACADFDLLEVAEAVVFGAACEGYAGVEEVDELGAAGEVVLGDGFPATALGRVGYDYGGEGVEFLEADEFHHKAAGGGAFLGVVADEGDVVDDEEACALSGGFFDGGEDFLLEVGPDYEFGGDLGAGEVGREDVTVAGGGVGVAHLELLGGKFEVHVHYLLAPGDVLGYLDGEDGLAYIAGGEDDGVLVLDDEVVEVGLGVGREEGFFYPVVGGLDGEQTYVSGGFARLAGFGGDGGTRVEWLVIFRHCLSSFRRVPLRSRHRL